MRPARSRRLVGYYLDAATVRHRRVEEHGEVDGAADASSGFEACATCIHRDIRGRESDIPRKTMVKLNSRFVGLFPKHNIDSRLSLASWHMI